MLDFDPFDFDFYFFLIETSCPQRLGWGRILGILDSVVAVDVLLG